jgi:hypothetical protein
MPISRGLDSWAFVMSADSEIWFDAIARSAESSGYGSAAQGEVHVPSWPLRRAALFLDTRERFLILIT